jgi:hypothetical protein
VYLGPFKILVGIYASSRVILPMTKQLNTKIARQQNKLVLLEERIRVLMSQRVTEEEKLAALIAQHVPQSHTTKNPVVLGGGQPFQGSQMVIVEKHKSDGTLDFSAPQPPEAMTFDGLYALYSKESDDPGNWVNLKAWLESKGWIVRAKTW